MLFHLYALEKLVILYGNFYPSHRDIPAALPLNICNNMQEIKYGEFSILGQQTLYFGPFQTISEDKLQD
jgi:hypothetical protein